MRTEIENVGPENTGGKYEWRMQDGTTKYTTALLSALS